MNAACMVVVQGCNANRNGELSNDVLSPENADLKV